MGYTTTDKCHEDLNLPQTPENVKAVRVRAGWTEEEAGDAVRTTEHLFKRVESGQAKLSDFVWRQFLDMAGRRVFDHE
jgi:hypothetical protein